MLARKRAAELSHQVANLKHRGAKRSRPFGGGEIEIYSTMDTALTEMTVVGCRLKLVSLEQPHKTAQVIAQARRRHRRILGARPGTRMARNERAGAQSRLTQAPDRALFRSG